MRLNDGTIRKTCRRFNVAGHAHELTFSCLRHLPLLGSDRTRLWLVEAVRRALESHPFDIWAYVISPDHVHLLVCPTAVEYSVSALLQSIKQPVARRATNHLRIHNPSWLRRLEFRRAGGRVEHQFWQPGGGYDRNVVTTDALWEMIRYIHLNPVRRGLVTTATDWRWSSARAFAGIGAEEDGETLGISVPPSA